MFRAIILVLIAIVTLFSFSFKPKRLKAPPGTVFLKDNLFIDKTEIGNVHWREFLQSWTLGIKHDTVSYRKMIQDTSVWGESSPFSKYYHNHPSFNFYPVVGISYEQVVAFCKWRSDRVNELFMKDPTLNPFPGKHYLYRLPTKEEWELAAAGKLNIAEYPYGYEDTIARKGVWKGSRLFNYKYETTKKKHSISNEVERSALTSPLTAYLPNGYGLYNMIGNVSEMISEKGIAKGGNYNSFLEECKIQNQQSYTKPEAWLGFRCVCEVKD